jgi:hypothetical protein
MLQRCCPKLSCVPGSSARPIPGGPNRVGLPLSGNFIAGHSDNLEHIFYVDRSGFFHEIYTGSKVGTDVITQVRNDPVALYSYVTGWNGQQHVISVGRGGSIAEVVHKDDGWTYNYLDADTALLPPPGHNHALHAHITAWNQQQHVIFVNNQNHIIELYNQNKSDTWNIRDLIELASEHSANIPLPGNPFGDEVGTTPLREITRIRTY